MVRTLHVAAQPAHYGDNSYEVPYLPIGPAEVGSPYKAIGVARLGRSRAAVLMLESWAAANLTAAPDIRLFGGIAICGNAQEQVWPETPVYQEVLATTANDWRREWRLESP